MQFGQKKADPYSLGALIRAMAQDQYRGTYELEKAQDEALREGRAVDPRKVRVSWEHGRRDLSATGAGTGAYLVGTDSTAVADALRPWSVALQAGITVLPGLTGNAVIPRVTADATGQWLSSELDVISASQPTLGQISLVPHTVAALCTFSKGLDVLQPQTEAFVRTTCMRVLAQTIDTAILSGTGIAGQPLGIINVPGVHAATGGSFAHADALEMQEAVANGGAEISGWIGSPDVRELLGARESAAGNAGFIWGNDKIINRAAYATALCPDATLLCGDWQHVVLASWGSGFDVSVDGFTGWSSGAVTVRIMASVDVAVVHPGAFAYASSIT